MPTLTQGAEAAEQISEEIKAKSRRGRVKQLIIKAGEQRIIRLVNDHVARPLVSGEGTMLGWVSVDFHGFIPTKDKPAEYTGQNWPKSMWAICQNDIMFRVRDPKTGKATDAYEDGYGNCYICAKYAGVREGKFNKDKGRPDAQVLAVAVIREPVTDPATGRTTGFRDSLVDWTDPDSKKTVKIPEFVVVNQKYSNFFGPIKHACFVEPQTVTNKDFLVVREENKYTLTPFGQTNDLMHGTPEWGARYEQPLARLGFDLGEYVLSHADPDHYARWFIEGATPKGGYAKQAAEDGDTEDAGAATPAAAASAAAAPAIDDDAMAAYAASLQKRGN